MRPFVREVLDALLVLAMVAAVGFLAYWLWRNDGKLPFSDSTPVSTVSLATPTTATRPPTRVSTASPTQTLVPTRTFTVTPAPTTTSRPTSTSTLSRNSTATLSASASTRSPADAEINDGIARGNQIVQAIEAYTQSNGFFPASLTDLVPTYLTELPVTISGEPFFYRVFERTTVMAPEIYWVSFRVMSQEHVTCTYYRRLEYWDCNFSSP